MVVDCRIPQQSLLKLEAKCLNLELLKQHACAGGRYPRRSVSAASSLLKAQYSLTNYNATTTTTTAHYKNAQSALYAALSLLPLHPWLCACVGGLRRNASSPLLADQLALH